MLIFPTGKNLEIYALNNWQFFDICFFYIYVIVKMASINPDFCLSDKL